MDTNPTWDWSSVGDDKVPRSSAAAEPAAEPSAEKTSRPEPDSRSPPKGPSPPKKGSNRRHYGPRTCRICFDTENPTFPSNVSSTFGISSASARPTYVSDDPDLGRLLSPCKCKGSQKYVHEGCLKSWRLSIPSAQRNFWQCPTCKYTYQMARLRYASILSSPLTRGGVTVLILVLSIFILGFIADPIVDLWFDPVGTIGDTVMSVVSDVDAQDAPIYEESVSWREHFVKGFFSLGVVGLVKSMFAMSPWHWINLRGGIFGGSGRRQGEGRARAENISLIFVIIGAFTFFMAIWKAVKALTGRVLARVSEEILDIGEDDPEEEAAPAGPNEPSPAADAASDAGDTTAHS